jgi:hypothetical protein
VSASPTDEDNNTGVNDNTAASESPGSEEGEEQEQEQEQQPYYLLDIKLRDDLFDKDIIGEYIVDMRTQNIRVTFTNESKYDGHSVISSISIKDWSSTIDEFERKLKKKGVDAEDIKLILNTLDSNNAMLVEAYIKAEKRLEAEATSMMMKMSFDDKFEVIRENVVDTFIDDMNKPVAVVQISDHVENRYIGEGGFREWIKRTYYDYAEAERKAAEEVDDPFAPSKRMSILEDEVVEKMQIILMYEALGTSYAEAKEYEAKLLRGFGDRNEIKFEEIYASFAKEREEKRRKEEEKDGGAQSSEQQQQKSEEEDNLNILNQRQDTRKKLYLRVASYIDSETENLDSNYVKYDIGDDTWTYIHITRQDGVRLVRSTATTPSPFKRYPGGKAQVYPVWPYPKDILDRFMRNTNVYRDPKNKMLTEVHIVSLFMLSDLPKPIIVPSGPQGTGKSTLQEHIKRLVDPNNTLTVTAQVDPVQAIQALSHSYLTIFDNVSEIKDWFSDLLCRVVTKTGFSKRQLYTDDTDFHYSFMSAIGFNGLNVTATKADLLERILKISLDPIDANDREKLVRINKNFEKMLPHLLAFIFDTIHKVLLRLGEVNLRGLPRMADWAELGELIARVLGYEPGVFIDAYKENLGLTSGEAIESNPVAIAVLDFMRDQATWYGSATQLLDELARSEGAKGHSSTLRSAAWPKTGHRLTNSLGAILANLRDMGIIYNRAWDTHANKYMITLVNQNWTPFAEDTANGSGPNTSSSTPPGGGGERGDSNNKEEEKEDDNTATAGPKTSRDGVNQTL